MPGQTLTKREHRRVIIDSDDEDDNSGTQPDVSAGGLKGDSVEVPGANSLSSRAVLGKRSTRRTIAESHNRSDASTAKTLIGAGLKVMRGALVDVSLSADEAMSSFDISFMLVLSLPAGEEPGGGEYSTEPGDLEGDVDEDEEFIRLPDAVHPPGEVEKISPAGRPLGKRVCRLVSPDTDDEECSDGSTSSSHVEAPVPGYVAYP